MEYPLLSGLDIDMDMNDEALDERVAGAVHSYCAFVKDLYCAEATLRSKGQLPAKHVQFCVRLARLHEQVNSAIDVDHASDPSGNSKLGTR